MIDNLPATEKQAFFGLLDEYFGSRPHRLPSSASGSGSRSTAARGGMDGLTDRATNAAGNAAGAAASVAVSNALRDQLARTGLGKGPPPPAPSASKKPGFSVPAGLTSGKTLGSLNLGSRTTSNSHVPTSTATAATPTRTLPPPTRTGAAIPPPAPTAEPAAIHPTLSHPEGAIGTAQVLYDYGDGSDPDDLQAGEGEQIWLTEKISADWWRGLSHDQGRQGIIPSAYVSASLY